MNVKFIYGFQRLRIVLACCLNRAKIRPNGGKKEAKEVVARGSEIDSAGFHQKAGGTFAFLLFILNATLERFMSLPIAIILRFGLRRAGGSSRM
jgi:hypothetical protein